MKKINICIVGAGNICQHAHMPVYKDRNDINIVAICDWNLERAQGVADEYGIPNVIRTVDEALEKVPEIEAVDICVWNRSHAPVAIAAAKAGGMKAAGIGGAAEAPCADYSLSSFSDLLKI